MKDILAHLDDVKFAVKGEMASMRKTAVDTSEALRSQVAIYHAEMDRITAERQKLADAEVKARIRMVDAVTHALTTQVMAVDSLTPVGLPETLEHTSAAGGLTMEDFSKEKAADEPLRFARIKK